MIWVLLSMRALTLKIDVAQAPLRASRIMRAAHRNLRVKTLYLEKALLDGDGVARQDLSVEGCMLGLTLGVLITNDGDPLL